MEKILFSYQPTWIKKLQEHDFLKGKLFVLKKWTIENIISSCKNMKISIIFPLRYNAYFVANKNKQLLKDNGIHFIIPPTKTAKMLKYKDMFVDFMFENGFYEHVPVRYSRINYPCVIKDIHSCNGNGIYIVKKSGDVNKNIIQMIENGALIQEYITGKIEYATHVLFHNNKIIKHSTNKYVYKKIGNIKTTKKQNFETIKIEQDKLIIALFEQILVAANYDGFCCIDYRIVKNNKQIKIFEINERIGGSLVYNATELEPFIHEYIRQIKN